MKQVFMSEDGKLFDTKEECRAYETKRTLDRYIPDIKDALLKVELICANRKNRCKETGEYCVDDCPFSTKYNKSGYRTCLSDCLFAVSPDRWKITDFFKEFLDKSNNGVQVKPCGRLTLCDYCENRMTCHWADE